ncbi:hypothetical protein SAMD00019534_054550 [Acytostelium subglobosum LB1]|uniref:hypothetical protein n=1 Tax=Acytostelium subglobosum LB1 TaxID=1410327 RepID=UPI000644CDAC|nr:hypothetical protein SAMD00019534_054550 [Acytostelium subglobosum LB1]GAM22280.1 hypothetical protein SAMD00019534_054550 [Acytostelium subglobosum LB1]|eukprot:XP_012754400.1 hypothetical protein SAMD00019534_054550 [Acytostelium subglobosum LB1]
MTNQTSSPTPQQEIYDLIIKFVMDSVSGTVSGLCRVMGHKAIKTEKFSNIVLGAVARYFNEIAHSIESRDDDYVNECFDKMSSINLHNGPMHPIDILLLVGNLSFQLINSMHLEQMIIGGTNTDPEAAHQCRMNLYRVHMRSVLTDFSKELVTKLKGCDSKHEHEPLQPGEDLFTLTHE